LEPGGVYVVLVASLSGGQNGFEKENMTKQKGGRVQIGGVAIDCLSKAEVCERLDALVFSGCNHAVVFCEANLLVQANRSLQVREAHNSPQCCKALGLGGIN